MTYELFANFNQEPEADWIDTQDAIKGRSVALDNEKYGGSALYVQLYRNTEHWKSYFYYRDISPEYQANVGFVVKITAVGELSFTNTKTLSIKKGCSFSVLGLKRI